MNDTIFTFHKTVIGYRHIQEEIPCQDNSISYNADDGSFQIVAVGDGHGDPACHRSAKGSEFAVTIAKKCLTDFAKAISTGDMDISSPRQRRECIEQLTNTIISKWYGAIRNDLLENEINDDDIKEAGIYEPAYRKGRRLEHLYGTTLMAALKVSNYFVLIHQGDGRCDVFYDDGSVDQPIPWDNRCKGSITTSMCDEDVFASIRSTVIDTVNHKVVACYLGSDGVEDSYYDNEETQQGTHRFYMDLSCKLCELDADAFHHYLEDFIPEFSRAGSADDVSIAGIVDRESVAGLIDVYKKSIEQYDYRQSLEKRLEDAKGKLISMTRKHGVLKQRLADTELTLNKVLDDRKKMECDINHLILKREELSGQAEVAKFELEAYRKEAQEARCSVEERYQSISSAIRLFVDEITAGYSRKEADYNQMLEKVIGYNEQIKEMEDKISLQDGAIDSLKQELSEAKEEFEGYDKTFNEVEAEFQQVQEKISNLSLKE